MLDPLCVLYYRRFLASCILVRYPVRREGEYLGFVAAGVTTREMSRVAAQIRELVGVSTYLTLDGRQVLARPELAECVEETGGTIDKYIGDALMAFWGAPQRIENSAAATCRAASLMAERLQEDNKQRVSSVKRAIRVWIGIHTGPLVVGNIGAPGRINYTVVGDTVNVAQRLEALGKEVHTEAEVVVLLSAATGGQLAREFPARVEGDFQLRGKQ